MPEPLIRLIASLLIFFIVILAAQKIAQQVSKWKLPLITGFLLVGMLVGPSVLNMLDADGLHQLSFINDFSLAFIALAAGTELYLKELSSRMRSILWNVAGQLVTTFGISAYATYRLEDWIPFLQDMDNNGKIAVALLVGVIFVARSPSSAIALINELRAKGPFVQTALGVTVIKDILVIVLFSICLSLALNLTQGVELEWFLLGKILLELGLSFLFGWLLGLVLVKIMETKLHLHFKTILILGLGFGVFVANHELAGYIKEHYNVSIRIEPLLVVLLGAFYVTNYSKHRLELAEITEENGPWIYAIFFTLTGASLSLKVLTEIWQVALILFAVRIIAMIIGSFLGGSLARDPAIFKRYGWMPYVTQAGVSIGLATEISETFPLWGEDFYTLVVAVIVINQIVGPVLFKYAIHKVGEAHTKGKTQFVKGQEVIIFGLEHHSIALARRLREHHWEAKIFVPPATHAASLPADVPTIRLDDLSEKEILRHKPGTADTAVLLLSDEENYQIAEILFEKAGTENIIVRMKDFSLSQKFEQLGAYIVNPGLAMVSLLDHYVRAPLTTSLLLGEAGDRDTLDIVIKDKRLDGVLLRDLKLPPDVIILAVKRGDEMVITHGYTKLHIGDHLTFVGSTKSLEKVALMCQNFELPINESDGADASLS